MSACWLSVLCALWHLIQDELAKTVCCDFQMCSSVCCIAEVFKERRRAGLTASNGNYQNHIHPNCLFLSLSCINIFGKHWKWFQDICVHVGSIKQIWKANLMENYFKFDHLAINYQEAAANKQKANSLCWLFDFQSALWPAGFQHPLEVHGTVQALRKGHSCHGNAPLLSFNPDYNGG